MERLIICETDRGRYAVRPMDWAGIWNEKGKIKESLNHLALFIEKEDAEKFVEWKEAEEQGRLLKLNCAVGDTVYAVSFRKKCYKTGSTYLVNDDLECAFCESESACKAKHEYFIEEIKATLPIIGNLIDRPEDFRVFLTRQEAEDKLAEMEGKK